MGRLRRVTWFHTGNRRPDSNNSVTEVKANKGCSRCAGVLRVCGALLACGEVAADVLRDRHGQDVGGLLSHLLHQSRVPPTSTDPRDGKFEAFGTRSVAFTEYPKFETLLVLCQKRVGWLETCNCRIV